MKICNGELLCTSRKGAARRPSHLPVRRRQISWAQLRRDFQAHAAGLAAAHARHQYVLDGLASPGNVSAIDV
jgi:hypothetical protein